MTDETLIADLIRSGVDADLVQRVALAIIEAKANAQVAVVPDEAAERRRAADRARKAAKRDSVCGIPQKSADSADKAEQPLPLSPSLPLPPQTPPSPAHPHAPAPAHPPAHACTREAVLPGLEPEAKPTKGRGTQAELEAYAVELGLPASDGTAMFDHWTANGWRNGQAASKCWRAGMRNWQRNGWMPSQKGAARLSGPRPPPERNAAYTPERAMSKLKPGETAQDF